MPAQEPSWPSLPLEEWQGTYETLHMYSQVVGKVRLELSPMTNHWWQVPLYLTARGLTTSPMPFGDRTFQIDFDFFDHQLLVQTSDGDRRAMALGASVRDFYVEVMELLRALGLEVEIWTQPVEVPHPIPFDQDDHHATYEPGHAHRFWQILRRIDVMFKEFRARFTGKSSPVHFFWGSFDLAVTRFSGRPAQPRPDVDVITRLSYNAELSSLGFWPGGEWFTGTMIENPTLYSYAFPEPEGYRDQPVRPEPAFYDGGLGEFVLGYEDVRSAADPRRMILDFAQSTFEAAARLQGWPLDELELGMGRPPSRHRAPSDTSALAASKAPNPSTP